MSETAYGKEEFKDYPNLVIKLGFCKKMLEQYLISQNPDNKRLKKFLKDPKNEHHAKQLKLNEPDANILFLLDEYEHLLEQKDFFDTQVLHRTNQASLNKLELYKTSIIRRKIDKNADLHVLEDSSPSVSKQGFEYLSFINFIRLRSIPAKQTMNLVVEERPEELKSSSMSEILNDALITTAALGKYIYSFRLALNSMMILKNCFSSAEFFIQANISTWDKFILQLKLRVEDMSNDIAWGPGNYLQQTKSQANWNIGIFPVLLFYDVLMCAFFAYSNQVVVQNYLEDLNRKNPDSSAFFQKMAQEFKQDQIHKASSCVLFCVSYIPVMLGTILGANILFCSLALALYLIHDLYLKEAWNFSYARMLSYLLSIAMMALSIYLLADYLIPAMQSMLPEIMARLVILSIIIVSSYLPSIFFNQVYIPHLEHLEELELQAQENNNAHPPANT